jgi:hypothetical protein
LSTIKDAVQQWFNKNKICTIMLNMEVLAGSVIPECGRYGIIDVSDYVPKHVLGLSR